MNQCRADLECDLIVFSGEFGGRFFGRYGASIDLQEMEEASCKASCRGLFQQAQEVFLLACNTLASKDRDSRTPADYLQVLLNHGFDRASAERMVSLRYGPLGPSFRESLRRIFMGVPRIYGFSSLAPRGEWVAERLTRYLEKKGDYAHYLQNARGDGAANQKLLAAFKDTSLVQTAGLAPDNPGASDHALVCNLYDETLTVAERLRSIDELLGRKDFLSFLPTIEVFLRRHPPADLCDEERQIFAQIRGRDAARVQVLALMDELNVSALQMELADLAHHLEWISKDQLHDLAVRGARQLVVESVSSESVDIACEITKHESLSDEFKSEDLPERLFRDAEGLRLVRCLSPNDNRISERLLTGLDSSDVSTRLWAAYALSARLPLDDAIRQKVASHLDDPPEDLHVRLQWILDTQGSAPAAYGGR